MRVICVLDELIREMGVSDHELGALVGINERTVKKVRAGGNWSLRRKTLEELMRLAIDYGFEGIFEVRAHPMWSTFERNDALIFRGSHTVDAPVETAVSRFLNHFGCETQTKLLEGTPDADEIAAAMKETNCLFIGSPKKNPSAEVALSLLYGARPFDASASNRKKVPVQIVGMDPPPDGSTILESSNRHGFRVTPPQSKEPHLVKVFWEPKEKYERFSGKEHDAAIVTICRSPLGTKKDVTTILVMGYTALATVTTMRELTHGEPPVMDEQLSQVGVPQVLAFRFMFNKHRKAGRKELAGTGKWFPPWKD